LFRTLRFRLFTSLILPMFLLVPLIGFLTIYFLESRVFLPTLASGMITEGHLIANDLLDQPHVWQDPQSAQAAVKHLNLQDPVRLSLLAPDQSLLATSEDEDLAQIGSIISGLPTPSGGPTTPRWQSNPGSNGEPRLEVVVPVTDASGQIVGLIRLTRYMQDLQSGLAMARWWVFGILLFGLAVNTLVGHGLARAVSRPIQRIAHSIREAPLTGESIPIAGAGFIEIDQVADAYNRLQARRYQDEISRKLMIANLVHELSRPLGSLQSAIYALKSGADSDISLRHELLNGMSERVERMGVLVNDLALTYRPRGSLELERILIDPRRWLEPLAAVWGEQARQGGLEWRVIWPADEICPVEIDATRMAQALGNLVGNALKFTPPGGRVTLSCEADERQICFSVADTGMGIAPQDQRRLFEPFFRSVQPGWKVPGLGLGLSIAKTIVEAHGGKISVESTPNAGSVFTIALPT
jgi:two-component system, OmpR family, sensor histidine kinase BaeS